MSRVFGFVSNSALTEQMAKIGPEIPQMTRGMTTTMREAVIVLMALQKTWMPKDARKEIGKAAPAVPPER